MAKWPLLPGRQGAEQRPAAACRSPGLEGGRQPRPGQGEQEAAPVKGIQQHQLDGGDQVGQIAEQGRRQQEQKEQGEHRLAPLPHKPAEQPQGQQNHQPGQSPAPLAGAEGLANIRNSRGSMPHSASV